jgi:CRP-like cAMP-binding protein
MVQNQTESKIGKRPVQQQARTLKTGEILFEEGSTGRELYIIQEGRVKVYKDTPEGKIELAVIEKGGTIGELSLLDNLPRSATVEAIEPTNVIIINQALFQSVMQAVPMWLQSIVKIVVSRLRDTNKRVDQAVLRNKERGMTSLLLLLFPIYKVEKESMPVLDYQLVLTDAYYVCRLKKKEIKSLIDGLEKRGIVQIREVKENGSRDVVIKDIEVLRLFDEYLNLKFQKQTFKELSIPDETISTLSNIAYVAQKSGQETEEGTSLMKSALMEDLSDKDTGKLERNLLDLRRRNLINLFPSGNDMNILFKKEMLSRIKKIKEWYLKFQMEI